MDKVTLQEAIKAGLQKLSYDEEVALMKRKNVYFHDGRISYMGMSVISEGKDKNCQGLGIHCGGVAQENYYLCMKCGEKFTTEGE